MIIVINLVETWSRDHAAAEVIQLRSPRRAHLEVPEAVNYPSPVVAHSTNG